MDSHRRNPLSQQTVPPPALGQKSLFRDCPRPSGGLRAGTKAQGPSIDHSPKPPGRSKSSNEKDRERWLREREREGERRSDVEHGEKRPKITPLELSPAISNPATSPVLDLASSVIAPPPLYSKVREVGQQSFVYSVGLN